MIFADKKYPVNIKDGRTFIYPANSLSLGDNILMTIISQGYFRDNPDEQVSLLPFNYDIVEEVRKEQPDKVFLRMDSTCVTSDDVIQLKEMAQVFEFDLHREAHGLWKTGIYPKFSLLANRGVESNLYSNYELAYFRNYMTKVYVVFHIRNIKTIRSKNTNPVIVNTLLYYLVNNYYGTDRIYVILVGNDESYGEKVEYQGNDQIVDLRKKLTLIDIDSIIESCQLYIGSDSGIAHLAACSDVPMVCWGFENEYWFPKVKNIDDCLFLTKGESKVEAILQGIKDKLD